MRTPNPIAAALRALADVIDAESAREAGRKPEWYDSKSYPHGARVFRRHIHRGMNAIRVGKGYRVRREDAEAFWMTLRRPPAPPQVPKETDEERWARAGLRVVGHRSDDSDESIRAQLRRAGIRLRGDK